MKVRPSVKKRCQFCKIIRRRMGRFRSGAPTVMVICPVNKRHKQRQGARK